MYKTSLIHILSLVIKISNVFNILNILSQDIFIPYDFLTEKINIILNYASPLVNKALLNMIEKKYIFLRDEKLWFFN